MTSEEKNKLKEKFEHGSANFTQEDLTKVINDEKIATEKSKNLGDALKDFVLLWSLLKDYYNKEYTQVPWKFIATIGFAVAYLILPVDIIPDVIPVLGYVDDATVFGFVVKMFASEIENYKKWKESKK